MTRSALFTALVLVAFVAPAGAQPPGVMIVTATADANTVTWTETVQVPVVETITVEVEVNGKKVLETRAVTVVRTQQITRAATLKDAKATDATGKAVAADKLAERLKKPTAVVVTSAALPAEHRALFKDDTLFLELAPPAPKDPNKGKK
jgi:hypothetical protein